MSTPHPVLPWMQCPHLSPAPSGDGGMPGMPPPPPRPALALSSGQGGHLPLPTAQLHMNGSAQRDSGAALKVGRRLSAPSTMCARQGLRPPSEGPHFQGAPKSSYRGILGVSLEPSPTGCCVHTGRRRVPPASLAASHSGPGRRGAWHLPHDPGFSSPDKQVQA